MGGEGISQVPIGRKVGVHEIKGQNDAWLRNREGHFPGNQKGL